MSLLPSDEYEAQVAKMAEQVRAWTGANGDDAVVFLLQFPRDVMLIGPVSEALEAGFLVGSPAAERLVRHVVAQWPRGREPTFLMMRCAVELARTTAGCPACGKTWGELSGVGRANQPKPGDVTLCIYCGEPFRFGPGLALERQDVDELPAGDQARIRHVQAAIRKAREVRAP